MTNLKSTESREIADAMYALDPATRDLLGVRIRAVRLGFAEIEMTVTDAMLNSARLAHGGLIFAFADSCLGFAACSHGPQALSQQASINWVKPAGSGDTLVARAEEVSLTGRSAVYDVTVTNGAGETVAVVRALTRQVAADAKLGGAARGPRA